jgi:hypothetical protein
LSLLFSFGFPQDGQDLIRLRLHLLSVKTYNPLQFGTVFVKVSLNFIHERYPAAPPIALYPGHALLELAFAIDHSGAAIGQL